MLLGHDLWLLRQYLRLLISLNAIGYNRFVKLIVFGSLLPRFLDLRHFSRCVFLHERSLVVRFLQSASLLRADETLGQAFIDHGFLMLNIVEIVGDVLL
jgi:hypothetical protein